MVEREGRDQILGTDDILLLESRSILNLDALKMFQQEQQNFICSAAVCDRLNLGQP